MIKKEKKNGGSNIERKFLHWKYFEGISISLNVITDKLK